MSEKDGGPAFPRTVYAINNGIGAASASIETANGMSLRDYFAGQALAGLTSSTDATAEGWKIAAPIAAELSYALADALLKARTQGE